MAEKTETDAESEGKKKRGKKAIIIPVVILLLGLGGGGFFVMSGGKKAEAGPATTTTTEPGTTVPLNAITMNLTDGHVLKVQIALEFTAKPKSKLLQEVLATGEGHSSSSSGSTSPIGGQDAKALDLANQVLGNSSYAVLSTPDGRQAAKEDLAHKIAEAYEGDVLQVYYISFVMS